MSRMSLLACKGLLLKYDGENAAAQGAVGAGRVSAHVGFLTGICDYVTKIGPTGKLIFITIYRD